MKTKEIRELSAAELGARIRDTAEELANLKFQHSLHQLDNTDKVRRVRRNLARMMTIQREIEVGIPAKRAAKAAAARRE